MSARRLSPAPVFGDGCRNDPRKQVLGQVAGFDPAALADVDAVFDDIAQLADIARKRIGKQQLQGPSLKDLTLLPVRSAKTAENG